MNYGIKLHVWGDFACFTRPEMKVERVSYDVITPSAARGIIEAIYWKPEIRWRINRLHVLNEIRFTSLRRNEVGSKIPAGSVSKAMKEGRGNLGIYVDDSKIRQQRAATILRDVAYVIEAEFDIVKGEDNPGKHLDQFNRRAVRGQCYTRPYLGIPLSALQHLLYCERQWALIHIERVWRENRLTAEGRRLHKNAHEAGPKSRDGERITRGLEVRSFTHGLFGVCDIVLWRPPPDLPRSLSLPAAWRRADPLERTRWTITPVEYKRGRPKQDDCDRAQLCGQALCLEEMLGVSIPAGQIFYGQTRRRIDVEFDDRLRGVTRDAAARLHELIRLGQTPKPVFNKRKCGRCSLRADCLPELPGRRRSASDWLELQVTTSADE